MFWLVVFQLHIFLASYSAAKDLAVAKPGCRTKCGNITVPFPFGIDPGCFREGFELTCRQNAEGYKLFSGNFEVLEVLLPSSQVRMNNRISFVCNTTTFKEYNLTYALNLTSTRFRISHIRNRLVALGCNVLTFNNMVDYKNHMYKSACDSVCSSKESLRNSSCFGIGCCEIGIPPGINYYKVSFVYTPNAKNIVPSISPCSFAVVMEVEADHFSFITSDVTTTDFWKSRNGQAPILLDWSISDETCKAAQSKKKHYACVSRNSVCIEQTIGHEYSCNCTEGYEGNPYLVDGCQGLKLSFYFH